MGKYIYVITKPCEARSAEALRLELILFVIIHNEHSVVYGSPEAVTVHTVLQLQMILPQILAPWAN